MATGGLERQRELALLFEHHHGDVWRYLARRAGASAADDLAAEVFAIAWRRLDTLPEGRARPWLFVTARNLLHTHYRDRGRTFASEHLEPAAEDDHADMVGSQADALAVLAQLSERDAEVLRLVAWEGLEGAEVAVALGCSRAAAAVRLHRARRRLEHLLDPAPERRAAGDLEEDHP